MHRFRITPRRVAVLLAATVGVSAGVAYAATLSVGSWHLWAGSQTLTKSTCTLTGASSTTDTYVDQSASGATNGSANPLSIQSTSGSQQWAFVRFNLSSCALPTTGGADTATLSLFVVNPPAASRNLSVTPVMSTWSDASLTWTIAQGLSYGPQTTTLATGTSKNTTVSTTVTIDVDALIKNPSANFGWRISDPNAGGATTIASADAAQAGRRPQLVINYEK
jgi:hypothetical protein